MAGGVTAAALALGAFLLASPRPAGTPLPSPTAEEQVEAPFVASRLHFADAAACKAHLAALVRGSAPPVYEAAVGPYGIAPGDVRAHRVHARDGGHEIEEFRCLGASFASRRWTHAVAEIRPFKLDDIRNMSFPKR